MGIIKTKEEIKKLDCAAKLGVNCFDFIIKKIKCGMSELEVASLINDFFQKNGATALSFDTIVGSGENSSLIHSNPSDRKIEYGDTVLIDMGCVLDGYCSDMSRTIFIGTATNEQRKIYDIVYKTYSNAINKIRVGMSSKEADLLGRWIIQDKGYDYAHALGHGVGTIVHEEPVISPKREDILEENMVFSIEPGIYLENKFGVRIEDVGVLTEDGMKMFSSVAKEIIII